jgi:hypothetical protein
MVAVFCELGHDVRVLGLPASGRATSGRLVGGVRRMVPATVCELASVGCNGAECLDVWPEIGRYQPDFLYKRHACNDVAALAAAASADVPAVLEVNCLLSGADALRRGR